VFLFLFDGFIIAAARGSNHQQCMVFLMIKRHIEILVLPNLKKVHFSSNKKGAKRPFFLQIMFQIRL